MFRSHINGDPLVEDQNDQVAKDTKQEQNLQKITNPSTVLL